MKIAVDGQTLTSPDADRGIGVYLKALIAQFRTMDEHDYRIMTWGPALVTESPNLRNVRLSMAPPPAADLPNTRYHQRNAALRRFVRDAQCRLLFNPNPLQQGVDAVARVTRNPLAGRMHQPRIPLVATIHDLTPLALPELFLGESNQQFEQSYRQRLEHLKAHVDFVLTDSEATKTDVMKHLGLPATRIAVAYCGVDPLFHPDAPTECLTSLFRRAGATVPSDFLLSVGGYNPKKNIPGLISAVGALPAEVSGNMPLVFAGPIGDDEWKTLDRKRRSDAPQLQMIRLGYVSNEELAALYCRATALPFVSLHEGFGLPIAEAMACGCPVVTGNAGSMPEVAGDAALLADPRDIKSISHNIARLLKDEDLRRALREKGLAQARQFTWERGAKQACQAFAEAIALTDTGSHHERKPKVSWFSPMPPMTGGVTAYSSSLITEVHNDFDVTVVFPRAPFDLANVPAAAMISVQEFDSASSDFDLNVYNMGNNVDQCEETFRRLRCIPGLTILHDLNIHGFLLDSLVRRKNAKASAGAIENEEYFEELKTAHGEEGERVARHVLLEGGLPPIERLPCNRLVTAAGGAVIVHSRWGAQRLDYNADPADVYYLPLGIEHPIAVPESDAQAVRRSVGLQPDELLVVSAGFLEPNRRVDKLLHLMSDLRARKIPARLLLAGNTDSRHRAWLDEVAGRLRIADRISWKGYVKDDAEFLACLAAADIVIHLRYPTNGESSATVLRALSLGRPVIVTNADSYRELPDNCCWKVEADHLEVELAAEYISALAVNPQLRADMSKAAREYVQDVHAWPRAAAQFREILADVLIQKG